MIDYSRISFENFPNITTPLNATTLNKLDKGIYDLDQGIGAKSDASAVSGETIFAKIGTLYSSINTLSGKVTNKVKYNGSAISSVDFQYNGTTLNIVTTP